MKFIILLALTTLLIAGSAAFFSVYGLAHVFSGAFWSVVIMGGALELGKLVGASFLYRFWGKINKLLKGGLIAAVIGLMVITSTGIFGYLSAAYQTNVAPFEQNQQQITVLEGEKVEAEQLKTERLARQNEINKQIANLPNDYVTGRRRLINANKAELDQINKDVAQYTKDIREHTTQLSELKSKTIEQTSHVGPIIYMAKVLGLEVDKATMWLIGLIIFVFDPLAIMLTIGTNLALKEHKKKKEEKEMQTTMTGTFTAGPFTTGTIELSDPPVYNEDRTMQMSKDGMCWVNVAPHAAQAPNPKVETFTLSQSFVDRVTSSPEEDVSVIGTDLAPMPPPEVSAVYHLLTKQNPTPQELKMREELETLLKRHQEVHDVNASKANS